MKLYRGECIAVLGGTGSGKTTLLLHMAGLLFPQSGRVEVNRRVGLLFQRPEDQLFKPTVEEDVAFGPRMQGLQGDELNERVRYGCRVAGLDYRRFAGRSIHTLSGGEKRKVALAGVLAMKPEVLLLDEPTAGLDPMTRREFLRMIRELNGTGISIVLITHHIEVADALAQHFLVLHRGQVLFHGDKTSFYDNAPLLERLAIRPPFVRRLTRRLRSEGWDFSNLSDSSSEESLLETIRGQLQGPAGGRG